MKNRKIFLFFSSNSDCFSQQHTKHRDIFLQMARQNLFTK
ncbi:hypothetical protein HMPREF1051_3104 [Neisseria sicca VK64]|uniref:Uncharacterized protein n=1 Tax=Neisseria sicca VK64 TaxID=1095748 RepID=I2NSD0_NEISI|nr:hypothetical protein HMPREF1051_3104 [Neisseria sicca VK64]